MRLPSGENRGSASGSGPFVSCLGFLPLACIDQMCIVPARSLTKTIVPLRRDASSLVVVDAGATRADLAAGVSGLALAVLPLSLTPDPSPGVPGGGRTAFSFFAMEVGKAV